MMTSEYMLYRARPQFGPFNTWQNPHFEPLGSVEALAVAIRNLFVTPLRWSRYDAGGWVFAEGVVDGHVVDLMFRAAQHGAVDYLVIRKGDGPTIVKLVEWLDLNFLFDPSRNKYLDPYHCDAGGKPLAARDLFELTPERRLGFWTRVGSAPPAA